MMICDNSCMEVSEGHEGSNEMDVEHYQGCMHDKPAQINDSLDSFYMLYPKPPDPGTVEEYMECLAEDQPKDVDPIDLEMILEGDDSFVS